MAIVVSCTRLRSGDWGVRSQVEIAPGDRVLARTQAGRTWPVVIDRIVWTDRRTVWIASTRPVLTERQANASEDVNERDQNVSEQPPSAPKAAAVSESSETGRSEGNKTESACDLLPCGKRPYIRVTRATAEELAWEPAKRETYYEDEDGLVRAGEQFAIVRPHHRFPLGHSSDHRRVVSHNATRKSIMEGPVAAGQITPSDAWIAGHGYYVAQTFDVRHLHTAKVAGVDVTHKLVVTNDHTGAGAMRASIVCYVGLDAIGSVAVARGRHVASNPEIWQGRVDAMIETAILKQDEVIELLVRAEAHEMTDEDRKYLRQRGIIVKRSARTALDAFRAWHGAQRGKARPTWGVWARRLDDKGLKELGALLDRKKAVKAA